MAALLNKHYGGHHDATEEVGYQGHLEKRSGVRNGDSKVKYRWREIEAVAEDGTGWRMVVLWPLFHWSDKA